MDRWSSEYAAGSAEFCAAVVPHAGWAFSGGLAYATMARCATPVRTAVVVGGHLVAGDRIRLAGESGFQTPSRTVEADAALRDRIAASFDAQDDPAPDNTVEVQLPLIAELFPDAKAVWMRCPPDMLCERVGAFIAEAAGQDTVVIGSTDLTHYGPSYGFTPAGSGERGHAWADQNDRTITEHLIAMDGRAALTDAQERRAACSVGAALCAIGFARARGCADGVLVERTSSLAAHQADSFVGYAGIGYRA